MTASLAASPGHADATIAAAAALVGAVTTWWFTRQLVGWLAAHQFGKAIRVDGPAHGAKAGTPTMGGLGMIGILIATALVEAVAWRSYALLIVALGCVAFAGLGLRDDLAGLARRSGGRELGVGMTARRMLAAQVIAALGLGALWLAAEPAALTPAQILIASVLFALTVLGTVNGANLADGLDGLAAGTAAIAFGVFAVVLLVAPSEGSVAVVHGLTGGSQNIPLGVLCAAAGGSCLGFLVHNRHPAKVFMGNVASMGLGATLALCAVLSGWWWLVPVVCGVFVVEVVSDLVQVGWFKASGGQRLLRMAPLHHHLEAGGMAEVDIVARFWLAGFICGLAGLLLATFASGRP